MGGVCAAVYLLLMILFMPFLFYTDIILATADQIGYMERDQIETGRVLHRFPLAKVTAQETHTIHSVWILTAYS